MATLSLCMIVKNEEDVLERCLLSARNAVDEMIVVDTGSSDFTAEIARRCGAEVHFFKWLDDFSAARNFAFSKATKDYIMWLDADDILKSEDLNKLIKLKGELDGSLRQVAALYNVGFDENGKVTLSYYRERLFLRSANFVWEGQVHEVIPLEKEAMYADFAVTHAKMHPTEQGRNLRILEKVIQSGKSPSARELYYYARELYYNKRYMDGATAFETFLTSEGRTEDKIGACILLSNCYARLGEDTLALKSLFKSFEFGRPRAEICCNIGDLFLKRGDFHTAAFWYNSALSDRADMASGAFINRDYYDYIPLLQLCVCYDRLGQKQQAQSYNEMAALLKPDSAAVKYNRYYFESAFSFSKS